MLVSSVIQAIPESGIRRIFEQAAALEKQGRRLWRFDIGQPDTRTPHFIVDAAKQALDQGLTRYVANRGIPELRNALAVRLQQETGVVYDPATDIVVTTGASEAVAAVIFAVLDANADVLIPEPAWPHYACCAQMAGARAIRVPLRMEDGYEITPAILERHLTLRTRLLVLNNPVNPTGKVYGRSTLEAVLEFARQHDLLVLADEMYDQFVYASDFCRFGSLPGAAERTLLVNGFSKSYGMTGWRLGYVAGPAKIIAQVNKAHQFLTVCATSFAQPGAVAACTHGEREEFLYQQRETYRERNRVMIAEAGQVPGLSFHASQGAFYLFARLPDWMPDASTAAALLLDQVGVAVVPGDVFGSAFGRFVRISYGTSPPEEIRAGMRLIASQFASQRRAA